tara:strand:+ start:76040 stop:76597 length:558 start_codon:yes stop_codon:yes gene_type:complete
VRPLPEIHSTSTIQELQDQCDQVSHELTEFIREIPLEYLNASGYPEGWSPARNVRHISNTLSYLASYIGAPAWVIKARGAQKKKAPRIEDVRPTNRPPRYDYGTYHPGKPASPEQREKLIGRFQKALGKFKRALQNRTEEDMDIRKGAFGGMNLRLFAEFALKHAVFHLSVVRTRLQTAQDSPEE